MNKLTPMAKLPSASAAKASARRAGLSESLMASLLSKPAVSYDACARSPSVRPFNPAKGREA